MRPWSPRAPTFPGRFPAGCCSGRWPSWTDPDTRYRRAGDLLVPGGTLALFGRHGNELLDPKLAAAVDEIERRVLATGQDEQAGSSENRTGDAGDDLSWPGTELETAAEFADVEQHDLPGEAVLEADDLVARLATVSAYLILGPSARTEALQQIRGALPDRVRVDTGLRVHLARRR